MAVDPRSSVPLVLIADAEFYICRVLEAKLSKDNRYRSLSVTSGLDALHAAMEQNFAVLLWDLRLRDTFGLLPRLRALCPNAALFLMTTDDRPTLTPEISHLDVTGILIKPFGLDTLIDQLDFALAHPLPLTSTATIDMARIGQRLTLIGNGGECVTRVLEKNLDTFLVIGGRASSPPSISLPEPRCVSWFPAKMRSTPSDRACAYPAGTDFALGVQPAAPDPARTAPQTPAPAAAPSRPADRTGRDRRRPHACRDRQRVRHDHRWHDRRPQSGRLYAHQSGPAPGRRGGRFRLGRWGPRKPCPGVGASSAYNPSRLLARTLRKRRSAITSASSLPPSTRSRADVSAPSSIEAQRSPCRNPQDNILDRGGKARRGIELACFHPFLKEDIMRTRGFSIVTALLFLLARPGFGAKASPGRTQDHKHHQHSSVRMIADDAKDRRWYSVCMPERPHHDRGGDKLVIIPFSQLPKERR